MAEKDLENFTGIKISHSTLQRLVNRQEFELPTSKEGVKEITLDGGKVRLRNETKGEACYWKDYKAVCLNNVYSGAFFQNNQDLIDGTNSQKLLHPMYCLGDGHAGVWNIFKDIRGQAFKKFCNYLESHRCRIINYQYYKEESISSIGSGTVESTIKRIGLRVKISGAQWNIENVSSILGLRCAYLNGQLSI